MESSSQQHKRAIFLILSTIPKHPELIQTGWHKTLSQAFPDIHRAISDYENGKFVHSPTGAGDVRNSSFTEKLLYLGLILKIIMRNI